jgi:hypothetical protein
VGLLQQSPRHHRLIKRRLEAMRNPNFLTCDDDGWVAGLRPRRRVLSQDRLDYVPEILFQPFVTGDLHAA